MILWVYMCYVCNVRCTDHVISQHEKNEVEQRVNALFSLAESHFSQPLKTPAIGWRKSGKNAGTANLTTNKINFNPVFFTHNRQAYFDEVIPHEVCHIIVYQIYGRVAPHGKQWQWIMRNLFEAPARTTHRFDLAPLGLKEYVYRCECGEINLSVRRHNKVMRNKQQYLCRGCRGILTFTGKHL